MTTQEQLEILLRYGRVELTDSCGEIDGTLAKFDRAGKERSITASGLSLEAVVQALFDRAETLSTACDQRPN